MEKVTSKHEYAHDFLPHAIDFPADIEVAFIFFASLTKGVMTLGKEDLSEEDRKVWIGALSYLEKRQ